jgi:hypothetical protein
VGAAILAPDDISAVALGLLQPRSPSTPCALLVQHREGGSDVDEAGNAEGLIDDAEGPHVDERAARAAADATLDKRDQLVAGALWVKGLCEVAVVTTEGDRIRVHKIVKGPNKCHRVTFFFSGLRGRLRVQAQALPSSQERRLLKQARLYAHSIWMPFIRRSQTECHSSDAVNLNTIHQTQST